MNGRGLASLGAGRAGPAAGARPARHGLRAVRGSIVAALGLALVGLALLPVLVAADIAAALRSGDPAGLERHLDLRAQQASLAATLAATLAGRTFGGSATAERNGSAARFLSDMSRDVLLGLNSAGALLAELRGRQGPEPRLRLRLDPGQERDQRARQGGGQGGSQGGGGGLALAIWPATGAGPPILLRLRLRWDFPPRWRVVAVDFPD